MKRRDKFKHHFFIFLNCVKCQGLTFGKNGIFTLQQHFQWVYLCCLLLLFIRWMPFKRGHLMHENGFTAHVKDMSKTCLISECPNILLILEATHLLTSNSNSVRRKFGNFYYVHVFRAILWLWFLFDFFFCAIVCMASHHFSGVMKWHSDGRITFINGIVLHIEWQKMMMSKFHYISLQQIVKLLWIPDDVRSSLIICLTGGVNKYGVSTSLLSRRQRWLILL